MIWGQFPQHVNMQLFLAEIPKAQKVSKIINVHIKTTCKMLVKLGIRRRSKFSTFLMLFLLGLTKMFCSAVLYYDIEIGRRRNTAKAFQRWRMRSGGRTVGLTSAVEVD